jgi:hypothetical protein
MDRKKLAALWADAKVQVLSSSPVTATSPSIAYFFERVCTSRRVKAHMAEEVLFPLQSVNRESRRCLARLLELL